MPEKYCYDVAVFSYMMNFLGAKGFIIEEIGLKYTCNFLWGKCYCAHYNRDSYPDGFAGPFFLTSAYIDSSYLEDLEIQILIDQADYSIRRGETTHMLHVLTHRSNSRQQQRRGNVNLPKPQRQVNYC
ncbi:hypothetical protein DPMN_001013 [Dreissena polymorpha]|uniref:Uncharacterized protein n=1 Tax=Dreissena polymorpha TaxID=45954 RepID=A0A9D4RQ05_DREPO|nr:hypothetical protein DPMN_001013 [Dreissena polymorpha]